MALGLRNPYRFEVQPNSGSHFPGDGRPGNLFVGDVGSNIWEELNVVTQGGQNFGWPLYEGFYEHVDFVEKKIRNEDAPNPLFGEAGCTEEFFLFEDLAKPPKLGGQVDFPNPCDPGQPVPGHLEKFALTPPALAYRHFEMGIPPYAAVPSFDSDGNATSLPIDAAAAGVEGQHFDGICSLSGLFYHAGNFPEEYNNIFFQTDYQGWIRTIEFDENQKPIRIEPFHPSAKDIVCLAQNPVDGCLYYVDMKGQELRKICYGGTPAPVAVAAADQYFGPSPLAVQFSAAGSFSPVGSPLSYLWDFGGSQTSTASEPVFVFSENTGTPTAFPIKLTVTDTAGQSRSAELLISLNNTPPQVSITSFPDSARYQMEQTNLIRLTGDAADSEHPVEELDWTWRTYLQHDLHEHTDLVLRDQTGEAAISPLGCHEEAYWYRVELEVTDAAGLTGRDVRYLLPHCDGPILDLSNLTATAHARKTTLGWQAAQAQNLTRFEVQRSSHIFGFEPIGEVAAEGDGSYFFRDEGPILGSNFYRLKIWNEDNIFSFSPTVAVDFGLASPNAALFPNPARGETTVSLSAALSEEVAFRLYNLQGVLLRNEKWQATKGERFSKKISLANLPDGVYYFELRQGGEVEAGILAVE